MPYASYCCPVNAPASVVWDALCDAVNEFKPSQQEEVLWYCEHDGDPLQKISWSFEGFRFVESVHSDPERMEIFFRLQSNQTIIGGRTLSIRTDLARGLATLEAKLEWMASQSTSQKIDDLDYRLQACTQVLVRDVLVRTRAKAEASVTAAT